MKTSVMKVQDMLSVLSVSGVEKRIGEVPGVESVTVDFAAGSATVRYDETRLTLADIRSHVRQSGSKDEAADDGNQDPETSEAPTAPAAPSADIKPIANKTPSAPARADASPPDNGGMKAMKAMPDSP